MANKEIPTKEKRMEIVKGARGDINNINIKPHILKMINSNIVVTENNKLKSSNSIY